jgi:hypothetical protein
MKTFALPGTFRLSGHYFFSGSISNAIADNERRHQNDTYYFYYYYYSLSMYGKHDALGG